MLSNTATIAPKFVLKFLFLDKFPKIHVLKEMAVFRNTFSIRTKMKYDFT